MREGKILSFDENELSGIICETRGSRQFRFTQARQRGWTIRKGRVAFMRRRTKTFPLEGDLVLFSLCDEKIVSWGFERHLTPEMLELMEHQRREQSERASNNSGTNIMRLVRF